MQIIRMQYSEDLTQTVAVDETGQLHFIPHPCQTWHKEAIQAFEAAGGVIEPYAPPREYWLNEEKHLLEFPEVLPEGASFEKPQPVIDAKRVAEIYARLDQIDFASIRPQRAINTGTATQFDHDKLQALEAEAQALRAELATLTGANNESPS